MDGHEANPGFALGQLARALTASATHGDPAARDRARAKVEKWTKVFEGMVSKALSVGSRTPVKDAPAWATLGVVKGGFATGELLAGGPLRPHERALLRRLGRGEDGTARAALNTYFLSEAGLGELRAMLCFGTYRVDVPEEGALLVVAWLLEHGHADLARGVLDELAPLWSRLRFYPVFDLDAPAATTNLVHLQTVGESLAQLRAVTDRAAVEVQRETLRVWSPLADRLAELFLETVEGPAPGLRVEADGRLARGPKGQVVVEGGWPCRTYPQGWTERARAALDDLQRLRVAHARSTRPHRRGALGALADLLARCLADPAKLTGRDVGRVRLLLAGLVHKRGAPGSARRAAVVARDARVAGLASRAEWARLVADRLAAYPPGRGRADLDGTLAPQRGDARRAPRGVRRAVLRCLDAPLARHVDTGVIGSGEVLARVVPQLTGPIVAAGIADPGLRRLFATIYGAFRRRRSLLLLNLESQVRLSELPWLVAVDSFRAVTEVREVARRTLEDLVLLALTTWPQTILPNKLLQEVRALAEGAGLDLPIVDEVAADIFMGQFTAKYLDAARRAAALLEGRLYATYYAIDCAGLRALDDATGPATGPKTSPGFAALCRARADEREPAGWGRGFVARNGKVIEQEQVLTTHNLAVLVDGLGLRDRLAPTLVDLARRAFTFVLRSHAALAKAPWKCRLRGVKNGAYAWRQLVFFLSFAPAAEQRAFLAWAREALAAHGDDLAARYGPVLDGLAEALEGRAPAQPYLGWATGKHPLLA